MTPRAAGAAFVDRSGAVVVVDPGFRAWLGAAGGDPASALRDRVDASPELQALLAGNGPAVASVAGDGEPVELERFSTAAGALLVLRLSRGDDAMEHGLRSQVLGRLVAGVAHDIKNPLNAMSLQLALLGDKLEGAGDASRAAAGHLSALRDQIGRVNEVLRRLVDVTDPAAPLGYTDLGVLLADVSSLFAYEARRRGIELPLVAHPRAVRTRCDPSRVGRLVLGLFGRALALTPDGGSFVARAEVQDGDAAVVVAHAAGDPGADLGYEAVVLAAGAESLGGRFERSQGAHGTERLTLAVPGNDRE